MTEAETAALIDLLQKLDAEVTLSMASMRSAGMTYASANDVLREGLARTSAICIASCANVAGADRDVVAGDFILRITATLRRLEDAIPDDGETA